MLTHPKEFDVVLPSFYFHVCFLFSAPLLQGSLPFLDFLKDGCGRQGGRGGTRKAEITDRRGQVLKRYVIRGDKSIFLLNYIAKYHVHKRNSSSIGGVWPPTAPEGRAPYKH
jgi:hypothetical protein